MPLFKNIQNELIARINQSTVSLKIAVTWFTNHDIFEQILNKLDNTEFKVDLIVLNDRINNKIEGIDFQKLIDKKGNFYYSDTANMVHHKFCIIDNKTVITGSYNWTYYAENRNWENVAVLEDKETVNAYLGEFEKIMQQHERIEHVIEKQKNSYAFSNDYLEADYMLQAKSEEKKGNDINAAKIYTELLKISNHQPVALIARNEILKKYNNDNFEVSPFEIGILFHQGYQKAIPAYVHLPYKADNIIGRTVINNQRGILISIQKNDYIQKTILQLKLDGIKPSPEGTEKIAHTLLLDKSGLLSVTCMELNGYGRSASMAVDIRKCL